MRVSRVRRDSIQAVSSCSVSTLFDHPGAFPGPAMASWPGRTRRLGPPQAGLGARNDAPSNGPIRQKLKTPATIGTTPTTATT